MAVLKWLMAAALAVACGYYGFMLSGWPGGAVAAAGAVLTVHLLFGEQWLLTVATVLICTYLVFFGLTDYGEAQREAAAKEAALARQRQSAAAGTPASGAKRAPATPALAEAPAAQEAKAWPHADGGGSGTILQDCPDCPSLVVVAPGRFEMGSRPGAGVEAREQPQHRVAVASFAAGRYAVTRREFAAFVKASGYKTEAERTGGCFAQEAGGWKIDEKLQWRQAGFKQGPDHPVVCVSWNDAQAYADWLSKHTRHHYRLLSEAEREYATRAGSTSDFWWGNTLSADKANYAAGSEAVKGTVPANQFAPNPFGLYNVHGNVWEWVEDCRHDSYAGAPADGSAWTANCVDERRVLRGGGWAAQASVLRAASRVWFTPDFRSQIGGFRVARAL